MSLSDVRELGDDALGNLWELQIAPISFLEQNTATILRVQNFNIPASGQATYEVPYKTQKYTRPNGIVEIGNEVTFDLRIDRNWEIYNQFVEWKNAISNTYTGELGNVNDLSTTMTVYPILGDGVTPVTDRTWIFEGTWIQNIPDISFDYTSGEPLVITITMGFFRMLD